MFSSARRGNKRFLSKKFIRLRRVPLSKLLVLVENFILAYHTLYDQKGVALSLTAEFVARELRVKVHRVRHCLMILNRDKNLVSQKINWPLHDSNRDRWACGQGSSGWAASVYFIHSDVAAKLLGESK